MKSLRTLKVKAFTLIEMLVVLLIISVLLLLFVPNLTKQKDSVTDTGNRAVVKVVESQAELYELNHQNEKASRRRTNHSKTSRSLPCSLCEECR